MEKELASCSTDVLTVTMGTELCLQHWVNIIYLYLIKHLS